VPTPNDGLAYAKRFIGNLPVDDASLKYRLLNDAHNQLWMAAPWPWSVAALEIVTLVNDQQDYNLSSHSDLLSFLQCSATEGQTRRDIPVSCALPASSIMKGTVGQVMYVPGSPQKLRTFPVPKGYAASSTNLITVYKKTATAIDADNADTSYSTISGVHDEWFWVYQELILLKAYAFKQDPRMGGVQVTPQGLAYSGQYATVMAGIAAMKDGEEQFFTTLGKPVGNNG
jgi:hypothetical protein